MTLKPRHIRGFLSLAPPALGECCHRSLARRGVAVRRRAIPVVAERIRQELARRARRIAVDVDVGRAAVSAMDWA